MKLHFAPELGARGQYALAGTKDELRTISDRLVKLLADMDAHDAAAAERAGERGIDPIHSVTLGLPEVDALEEVS